MDKFEILERLENTGVDVAAELVGAMSDTQADDLLGYIARMWDIDLDEDEDEDETAPRYANPEIQAAYEWACEWVCDSTTAAHICDQCDAYGSTVVSVTADEWYSDSELREDHTCLIGEDAGLSTFIIELR